MIRASLALTLFAVLAIFFVYAGYHFMRRARKGGLDSAGTFSLGVVCYGLAVLNIIVDLIFIVRAE